MVVMRWGWLFVSIAACGRIGIDEHLPSTSDAQTDGVIDAFIIDAAPACPADMTRLSASSMVCIELADRGPMIWLDGKAVCEAAGRRYCADAEWVDACTNATGLVQMTGDDYEWVAEMNGGVAEKRGAADCADLGSHVITDPYEVRCCGPML